MMPKLKLQYFGHLMRRVDSFMLQIKTMNCGHIITAFVCPNANPKDKNKSYM